MQIRLRSPVVNTRSHSIKFKNSKNKVHGLGANLWRKSNFEEKFYALNEKLAEDEFWASGGSEFQSREPRMIVFQEMFGHMEWKELVNQIILLTLNVMKKNDNFKDN